VETLERAAHARSVATAKGRRLGRPTVIDAEQLDYASHLRDTGHTINEIVAKTGITPAPACTGISRPVNQNRSPSHDAATVAGHLLAHQRRDVPAPEQGRSFGAGSSGSIPL
jgi:hypothetical protein